MLPRKLHIEQIDRFHNAFKILSDKIDIETDVTKKHELSMTYYKLTKLWETVDNSIEVIKDKLDSMNL
jgi:hypothetical protein